MNALPNNSRFRCIGYHRLMTKAAQVNKELMLAFKNAQTPLPLNDYAGTRAGPPRSVWTPPLSCCGYFEIDNTSPAHVPHDVVTFAEEGEPVVENLLLLVRQILPVGSAVFGLERGQGQGSRGIFASKYCRRGRGSASIFAPDLAPAPQRSMRNTGGETLYAMKERGQRAIKGGKWVESHYDRRPQVRTRCCRRRRRRCP